MGRQPALNAPVLVLGPVEPPIGGVSRYCRSVTELLRREGTDAVHLDPGRPGTSASEFLARALTWPVRRALGASTFPVLRAVRKHKARLVLDNRQVLWRDPAEARGLRMCVRVPYALAIHDGAFPGFVEALGERRRRGLSRALEGLSAALCMSDAIVEAVLRTAPRARARRLSPLLEAPGGPGGPLPRDLEAFFGMPGPVISASGALHPQYGIEELLAAFAELRRRGRSLRVVILIGSFAEEPSTRSALAEARARFGDGAILVLTDFADGAAVIARSQVYVRPSRIDSFGMALHEALLSGVPVVASEHPTRPEGVVTYRPGDVGALTRAIESALLPAAKSAAAERAPRLREMVERNGRETLEVLRALVGHSPSAPAGIRGRAGFDRAGGR